MKVKPSAFGLAALLLAVLLGWTAVALLGGYAIFRRFSPGFAEEV